jgi:hypothetical protein
MRLGFTGTRAPITTPQKQWLWHLFETMRIDVGHHGACVNADEEFHLAALAHNVALMVHPSSSKSHRAQGLVSVKCLQAHPLVTVLPAKPPLNRDRDIVGATEGLVALPVQMKEPPPLQWGGTWYCVNYAARMNRPVVICYPDGRIEKRNVKER